MFNNINYKRVSRSLVLLTFLAFAAQIEAQNTVTIKTGFSGNFPSNAGIMQPIGDTLRLYYDYAKNNDNILTGRRLVFYNKTNLRGLDTLEIARTLQPPGSEEGFEIYKDKSEIPRYYLSFYKKNGTNGLGLEFYRTNALYQLGSLAFSKSFSNRDYIGSALQEDKIYLVTANNFLNPDTVFLNVIDTTGNNTHQDFYTVNDSSRAVMRMIAYRQNGVQFHPAQDSLLILPSFFLEDNYIALINVNNTQKVREIKLPNLFYPKNGLFGNSASVFKAYNDGFVFAGYGGTIKFFPNTPNFVPVYYKRSWDNDSLELKVFNKMQQDMRAFAFNDNPYSDDKYIVGSVPFDRSGFTANETREVVIYRWNQWGQDSIVLFGEQNHVATDVAADKNGDLYVCGTFNDFPNSDSNFVFLTKIPQYAIGLIDKGEIEPRFRVYPNPTAQHLHLSTEPEKLRHARYRVVNEAGATQLQGSLSPTEATIDVSSLSSGTYLLFIEYKEGSTSNALFLKE